MGIQLLSTPQMGAGADAGIFNLPPKFDQKKLAAEWVEESSVPMKEQRQSLPGANATADGWTVWRAEANSEPTKVRVSGGRTFVLMCRDAELQKQVNAIFGNVSKKILAREIKGETVQGERLQDPGILTEDRLRGELGGGMGDGEGDTKLNDVKIQKADAFEQVSAAQET